jgi:hypothetical protein
MFLMSGNEHIYRGLKFFGAGAIVIAFLATWL